MREPAALTFQMIPQEKALCPPSQPCSPRPSRSPHPRASAPRSRPAPPVWTGRRLCPPPGSPLNHPLNSRALRTTHPFGWHLGSPNRLLSCAFGDTLSADSRPVVPVVLTSGAALGERGRPRPASRLRRGFGTASPSRTSAPYDPLSLGSQVGICLSRVPSVTHTHISLTSGKPLAWQFACPVPPHLRLRRAQWPHCPGLP